MKYLSLFSGGMGGDLACQHLLGWECIGYVEKDEWCQRLIAARIKDGYVSEAPIFGDIKSFNRDGYAESYQGMVDCVVGGFPCTPFSCAGKRRGADDDRNMWPETIRCIRTVRPRFCFLENVPGLVSSGYFSTVLGDLVESGYDARWRILSAGEVGAPHKRDRLWVVADAREIRCNTGRAEQSLQGIGAYSEAREDVADAAGEGRRLKGSTSETIPRPEKVERFTGRDGGNEQSWWNTEPGVGQLASGLAPELDLHGLTTGEEVPRVAKGVPDRVNRLRALGNGQVPLCAATAWRLLTEDAIF